MLKWRAIKLAILFDWFLQKLAQLNAGKNSNNFKSNIIWKLLWNKTLAKSLKLLSPFSLKWWPSEVFAKFVKDAFYLASIFQLHIYQVGILTSSLLKMLLRHFRYFHFYNINMTFVKHFIKNLSLFKTHFYCLSKVLRCYKVLWSGNCWK